LTPGWLWLGCIGVPWLYSLRRPLRRLVGDRQASRSNPMVVALRTMWLGRGVFFAILGRAAPWSGGIRQGLVHAVAPGGVCGGVLGAAFFAASSLANLVWLRWVAVAWWAGELVVYALRHRPEAPLASAILMLVLLAGPGLVLVLRAQAQPRR